MRAGGPSNDRVFFFDFESRQWSQRMCKDVLPGWLFSHATKRGRSIFAFGSSRGENGLLEVSHRACFWNIQQIGSPRHTIT